MVNDITEQTLGQFISRAQVASLKQRLAGSTEWLVPDPDELREGDIILASPRDYTTNPIYLHQRALHKDATAKWTHAMFYVGMMHVAESNVATKSGRVDGTAIVALTDYLPEHELLVCRNRLFVDEKIRLEAVQYALLNVFAKQRPYDRARIAEIAIGQRIRDRDDAQLDAVICSDFVLEVMAIGGTTMLSTWAETAHLDWLPCDFSRPHEEMDRPFALPMRKLREEAA